MVPHWARTKCLTREALGWHHDPFVIPDEMREAWDHGLRVRRWKLSGSRLDAYRELPPRLGG